MRSLRWFHACDSSDPAASGWGPASIWDRGVVAVREVPAVLAEYRESLSWQKAHI